MAATMLLGVVNPDGLAQIFVRIQDRRSKTHIHQATGLFINQHIWEKRNDEKFVDRYAKNPDVRRTLETASEIRRTLDSLFKDGKVLNKDEVRELVHSIVYREEIAAAEAEKEEKAREEERKNRMTLFKFIDKYIEEVSNGGRQTANGTNYSPNTVKSIKQALTQFRNFCKWKKKEYDFDDIDMQFYYDYTAYLKKELKDRKGNVVKKAYNVNSVGKCVKELKVVMYTAESEGHHKNDVWKDKRFKGTRIDVDSIYLTKDDLAAIQAADLSKYDKGHEWARDIFMAGVWTAQRVSDYNNISKDQIETHTKRWIEDVPDPEHPGQTKPEIRTREIMFINIRQQKTGAKVSIPVSTELKAILEKYDFQLPHLEDQVINRYLKDICQCAGLTEEVEIVETTGGTPVRVKKPKYELVHTHTARRTGATLMYLSGMDVYDIIKITGHTSPVMLRKYIKADKLEVIEKITEKYNYFD
ncbi:MAG: phage integrase SAM-like domain-containing protein [Candidatus Cryptobacteroides sp.]|nr:site-specific integrase [Bacteroidales bacterium]MDY2772938.1 phage integrase SAM-like domain-containing protein [Candidatus Cryptobacteroides sp.]